MQTIYVVGNSILKIDSLPLLIMGALKKEFPDIEFSEFDPTENFPDERKLIILDTVIGLEKVEIIGDIEKFEMPPAFSLHDFDLAVNLKLMKKAGMIDSFKIIGVPPELNKDEAAKQVSEKIKSTLL